MAPPSISFEQAMSHLSRISLILEPWLDLVPFLFFWVGSPNVCGVAPSHLTSLCGTQHHKLYVKFMAVGNVCTMSTVNK